MATEVENYIRRAAVAWGMDPEIAVAVAKSEGGLQDPFRHGEGPAPKSQARGLSATENSFGPFQLYISGNGAGLGDRAVAAGIDPRKDWQAGVDFALKEAADKGWGQWYGAKAQGITGKMGINVRPGVVMPDGPKGQEMAPPPLTQGKPVNDYPIGQPGVPTAPPAAVVDAGAAPESGLGKIFAALAPMAGSIDAPSQDAGPTQSFGSGDPMGATNAAAEFAGKAKGLASGLSPDIDALMSLGKRPRVPGQGMFG